MCVIAMKCIFCMYCALPCPKYVSQPKFYQSYECGIEPVEDGGRSANFYSSKSEKVIRYYIFQPCQAGIFRVVTIIVAVHCVILSIYAEILVPQVTALTFYLRSRLSMQPEVKRPPFQNNPQSHVRTHSVEM